MTRTPVPLEFRIVEQIELSNNGCWLWTGRIARDGYGRLPIRTPETKYRLAHRVAYETLVEQVPSDLEIDHLCRERRCVNPAHLEPVSSRVNTLRGYNAAADNARLTHCKRGHEFNEQNTRVNERGHRYCKVCAKERARERRLRMKRNAPRRTAGEILASRMQSVCAHGHVLNEQTMRVNNDDSWSCRICDAASARERRARRNQRKDGQA